MKKLFYFDGLKIFIISLIIIVLLSIFFKEKKHESIQIPAPKVELETIDIKIDSMQSLLKKFDATAKDSIIKNCYSFQINKLPTTYLGRFGISDSLKPFFKGDSTKALYYNEKYGIHYAVLNFYTKGTDTLIQVPIDLLFPLIENVIKK
jgi:hypothetical protein